jgi:hypothetical protein
MLSRTQMHKSLSFLLFRISGSGTPPEASTAGSVCDAYILDPKVRHEIYAHLHDRDGSEKL